MKLPSWVTDPKLSQQDRRRKELYFYVYHMTLNSCEDVNLSTLCNKIHITVPGVMKAVNRGYMTTRMAMDMIRVSGCDEITLEMLCARGADEQQQDI